MPIIIPCEVRGQKEEGVFCKARVCNDCFIIAPLYHVNVIRTPPTASNSVYIASWEAGHPALKSHVRFCFARSCQSGFLGNRLRHGQLCPRTLLGNIPKREWEKQDWAKEETDLWYSHSWGLSRSHMELSSWDGPSKLSQIEARQPRLLVLPVNNQSVDTACRPSAAAVRKQRSGQSTTTSTPSNSTKINGLGGKGWEPLYRIHDLKGRMTKSKVWALLWS